MSLIHRILKKYSTLQPLDLRITKLKINPYDYHVIRRKIGLSNQEIEIVEKSWNGSFSINRILLGYTIFSSILLLLSFILNLSNTRFFLFIAIIASVLSSGVSVFLNKEKIEKLDQWVYNQIRLTETSIKYFLAKSLILSSKSSKEIQLEFVFFTTIFLNFIVILFFIMLSNLGLISSIGLQIIDNLTLSFSGNYGWNIWLMNAYILLCIVTCGGDLDLENKIIKKGFYNRFFNINMLWNLFIFVLYFIGCYIIISRLNELNWRIFSKETVINNYPIFLLGLQNLGVIYFHQKLTLKQLNGKPHSRIYFILCIFLAPYLIFVVFALQLIPGLFVILGCLFFLYLFKLSKVLLRVPSFVRVLGFMLSLSILIIKFIISE